MLGSIKGVVVGYKIEARVKDFFSCHYRKLNLIKSELDLSHKQGIKIMRSMMMELEKNLPRMGLVLEDQEQYILDRVDQAF